MLRLVLADARSSLKPWLLFTAVALVPATALGAIALRATHSEEAARIREMQANLDSATSRLAKEVENGDSKAATLLFEAQLGGDDATVLRALERCVGCVPAFADAAMYAESGVRTHPQTPGTMDADEASASCVDLVSRYALLVGEQRDVARRKLMNECPTVRAKSGRRMWPLFALENRTDATQLATWTARYGATMRHREQAALFDEVGACLWLDEAQKAQIRATLEAPSSRAEALVHQLEEGLGRAVVQAANGPRQFGRFSTRGGFGSARALADGRRVAFVVHAASLHAFVQAQPSEEIQLGIVTEGGANERLARTTDALVSEVSLGGGLRIRATPRRPDQLEQQTQRSKRIVLLVAGIATLGAFVLAAWLFARLRSARRLSELRTDFVAAISHELRTPVASIQLLSECLEQGSVPEDEQREVFAVLASETRRLSNTLSRMLSFGAMTRGRLMLQPKTEDVTALVTDTIETFERSHSSPTIERHIADDIRFDVDATLLRMALTNLLANAVKYAPNSPSIHVSLQIEDASVELAVTDRGPGIPRRMQRRIFEPFERGSHRLSDATSGSGIGLAIVRYVARAHGGDVTVKSGPSEGSIFTIRWPRRVDRQIPPQPPTKA
jgi:signal transduction histidine kinase